MKQNKSVLHPNNKKDSNKIIRQKTKINTNKPAKADEKIASQKEIEKLLKQNIKDQRALIEQASDAIFIANERGEYIDVNKKACDLLGYTKKELLKLKMIDIIPPEDHNLNPIKFDLIETKNPTLIERRLMHKSRKIIDVEISGIMLKDGRMQGIVRDITERKKVEAALKQNEKQFRITFENAPIGVCLTDHDGRFLKVNKTYCEMLGYTKKELLAIGFPSISHPEELQQNLDLKNLALAGEIDSFEMEKRYKTKNGTMIWVLLKSSLVRDGQNNPLYFIAHIQDITERKKSEKALKESRERYKALMEEASDAIFITSGLQLLDTNNAATKLLGYSKKELFSMDLMTIYHPDDAKKIRTDYATVISSTGSSIVEARIRCKGGGYLWMEISTKTLRDGRVQSIARNITVRKQAEEALRESEARYRTLAEVAHDMIFIIDKEDRVEYVNSFAAEILGMEPEKVIGKKRSAIFPPDMAIKQGQSLNIVFETGKPMYAEGKMLANNKWINIDTSLAPIKNEDDEVTAILGISRNITEVKQADELSNTLNTINAKINSTLDFDKIMQSIAEESRKAIGCDSAIINLREDDHWVIGYVNGLIAQISPDTVGMRFSDLELKAATKAIKTREIIVVQDAVNDPELNSKIVDKFKVRSMMIAPLFVKDEIIGNLYYIYRTDNVEFEPAQIDFAHKLSTSLSFAIQNAHLYQEALKKKPERTPDNKKRAKHDQS